MSVTDLLKTDDDIQGEEDRLGGGGLFDSDIYDAKVTMAYLGESKGGAISLNVHFEIDGRTLRQTFWMTSGKEKGQKNYYINKNDEKRYLPGFNMANALSLLTVAKEIGNLDAPESKVINLWDFEQSKEVPTEVPVYTQLLNETVRLGVIRQIVDKTAKQDNGSYAPTGETREENEVDKMFRARDNKTTTEIRAKADATFHDKWLEKNQGEVRNKASGEAASGGVSTGKPSTASSKPTESLFED